jgi:hypothetical protein
MRSLSMSLAQVWQSHIPLAALLRPLSLSPKSNLGPPEAAAVMCAATPTLTTFEWSLCGSVVSARQDGFEQRNPTRWAKVRLTARLNSSLERILIARNGCVSVWGICPASAGNGESVHPLR